MIVANENLTNSRFTKFRDVGCMGRVISENQLTTLERADAENKDLSPV